MDKDEFEMVTQQLWNDHYEMRFYFENEMAANEILQKLAYLYSEKYPRNYHRL